MKNSGTFDKNLDKSIYSIEEAAKNGADIILFPEVHLTEFFPQYKGLDVKDYAVALESDVIKRFCNACRKNNIMAVPNIYLEENGKCYDASIMIDKNGEILGIQKMVHIAYAEKFYETDYYAPSDDGFKVFDTPLGRIGIVVCFDRHYPESIRTETLMDADLILIPTVNTLEEPVEMFEQEIRVQAFQNSVFIRMCNRTGKEGTMHFYGESLVVSPAGNIINKADSNEQILYTDIDLQEAERIRKSKSYTNLRRKEFYM